MVDRHDPTRLILGRVPLDPTALATEHAAEKVFLDARHCTAQDLRALAALPSARALEISGLRTALGELASAVRIESLHLVDPATLDGLEKLGHVRQLTVYHLPKIHDLAPVGRISNLRTLLLSTPPGYDSSRKCFKVTSFEPLGRLAGLEQLTLRGIEPLAGGLDPLHALTRLRRLDITHVYAFALEDYARLARALPNASGHCLEPFFRAEWAGTCARCGEARIVLTGPRPRRPRFLCPVCNRTRLEEHVTAWRAAAR